MIPSRLRVAALAALLVLAARRGRAAAPPTSSRDEDARALAAAREGLDDAIDTEETLRTSKAQGPQAARQVRRIVSRGAFESGQLDEFGLASLGELGLAVPSLVILDSRRVPSAPGPRRHPRVPALRRVESAPRAVRRRGEAGGEDRARGRRAATPARTPACPAPTARLGRRDRRGIPAGGRGRRGSRSGRASRGGCGRACGRGCDSLGGGGSLNRDARPRSHRDRNLERRALHALRPSRSMTIG